MCNHPNKQTDVTYLLQRLQILYLTLELAYFLLGQTLRTAQRFQLLFKISHHTMQGIAVVNSSRLCLQLVRQLLVCLMCFDKLCLENFQSLQKYNH